VDGVGIQFDAGAPAGSVGPNHMVTPGGGKSTNYWGIVNDPVGTGDGRRTAQRSAKNAQNREQGIGFPPRLYRTSVFVSTMTAAIARTIVLHVCIGYTSPLK
jgi:hypothetical protein